MQVRWLWRRAGAWHGRRFWEFLFGDREKTSATTQLLESLRLLKVRRFFPVPMLERWRTKCLITVYPTKNKHLTRNISTYLPFWHICKSAFVGGQGQLKSSFFLEDMGVCCWIQLCSDHFYSFLYSIQQISTWSPSVGSQIQSVFTISSLIQAI